MNDKQTGFRNALFFALAIVIAIGAGAESAFAQKMQTITLVPNIRPVAANQAFTVDVNYNAYDTAAPATFIKAGGIAIRVFYDSSVIDYQYYGSLVDEGGSLTDPPTNVEDTANLDGDDSTTHFLQASWGDFTTVEWPTQNEPLSLATLFFIARNLDNTLVNAMIYQSSFTPQATGIDWFPPIITLNGPAEIQIDVNEDYVEQGATATDNVDGDVTPTIESNVDTTTFGVYQVVYTATDSQGNTASVLRVVRVGYDTTPPVIELLGDNPMTLMPGDTYSEPGATAEDDIDGTLEVPEPIGTVDTSQIGVYILYYRVEDSSGNVGTAERTVEVVADTIPPEITINGANPAVAYVGQQYEDEGAVATDNLDGPIAVTTVSNTVDTTTPGTYQVVYNATDSANNTASATRVVTVEIDTVPPEITILGVDPAQVLQGETYTDLGATALDNVDGVINNVTVTSNVNTNIVGTYQVNYMATDASGNTAEAIRSVEVLSSDVTPPVITVLPPNPASVTVGTNYADAGATAWDNVDGALSVTATGNVNTSTIGTYQIQYSATDTAGNVGSATRTVNVVSNDTEAPIITILGDNPADVIIGTTYVDAGAEATDNLDGTVPVEIISSNVNTNVLGSYQVIYRAEDSSGNSSTAARGVNVIQEDTVAPVISIAGDNPVTITVGGTYIDAGATATDNIDGIVAVTSTSNVNVNAAGTYQVEYSATDAAGNIATATRTVNVVSSDTVPPVITLNGDNPMDILVGAAFNDPHATAIDDVDGAVQVTVESSNVNTAAEGNYQVVYLAADNAGNEARETRVVRVIATDTTPPVITLLGENPMPVTLNTAFNDPGATAQDNIDGSVAVTVQSNNVDTGTEGTYQVVYRAVDSAGNEATETREVQVSGDTTPPVITIAGSNPVTVALDSVYQDAGATAQDDVDGVVEVTKVSNVDTSVAGTYTVTYTAEDTAGNTAEEVRTVIVADDNTPPEITLNGDNPMTVSIGGTYNEPGANAYDTVDGTVPVTITGTVNTSVEGTYTKTYTATDSSGNTAEETRTVIVEEDTTPPQITLNGLNPMAVSLGADYYEPGATAYDAVDGTVNVLISGTVNTNVEGTYTKTYEASDSSGNTSSVQRTVNVVDNQGTSTPRITIIGDNPMRLTVGDIYTEPGATATDSIDGTLQVRITGNVNTSQAGTYRVTYTATNSSGRTARATRTVYVSEAASDTTPPVITIQGNNPSEVMVGSIYTDAGATATDNNDGNLTYSISVNNTVNTSIAGTYTVTYSVSDAAGNSAQAIRTVKVVSQDTAPPQITILGDNPVSILVGMPYSDAGATAYDLIDGNLTAGITTTDNVNTGVEGVYTVVYRVSDLAGNMAQAIRVVKVLAYDMIPPVITVRGDNPMFVMTGSVYIDPGATAWDAIDGDVTHRIYTLNNVNAGQTGIYTVTYYVDDNAGNSIQAARTVVVTDTDFVRPVITILGDNPKNALLGSVYADPGATAMDNIDGDLTSRIVTVNSVNTNAAGTYTVSYYVTDNAGNSDSEVREVNVVARDTIPPEIEILGDDPASVKVGDTYYDAGAIATDDIDDDALVTSRIITQSNVNTNQSGTYSVTYTVVDSAGNQAEATRTVQVVQTDTVPPVITLIGKNPAKIVMGTPYYDAGATATDNIDDDILMTARIIVANNVNSNAPGSYTVRYNVTDTSGNAAAEAIRTVEVVTADTTAPVITLLGDNPMSVERGASFYDPGATATDDIDDDTFITAYIYTSGYVDTNMAGTYYLAYNVSDTAGNQAQEVVRTVEVYEVDQKPGVPVILSPANGQGGVYLNPVLIVGTPSDPGADSWRIQWQIATDLYFNEVVFDRTGGTWSITIPDFILDSGPMVYFWRVRFISPSGVPSDWSETHSFRTVNVNPYDTDGDGTPDDQEVHDPGLDLDGDGTADIVQSNMVVVYGVDGYPIGAAGSGNTIVVSIVAEDPDALPNNGNADMSDGLVSVQMTVDFPGDTAQFTLYYSEAAPANAVMYYYDSVEGIWVAYGQGDYQFSADRKSVTVTVADGGPYDADGIQNKIVILKPSGFGVPKTTQPTNGGGGDDGGDDDSSSCFISAAAGHGTGILTGLLFLAMACCPIPMARNKKRE